MTVHPKKGLLHQVFGPLPVADHAVDEVEQTDLIAVDQLPEGAWVSLQVGGDQVVHLGDRCRFRLRAGPSSALELRA